MVSLHIKLPRSRAARYLNTMLIEQFQLITIYSLILQSLILYIIRYHFFITISSYCVNIVPICPEMPSPQYFFYFPVSSKYFLARDTLDYLHCFSWRHYWNSLYQKMHMIFVNSNLHKVNLISLPYSYTDFLQCLRYLSCKNLSPVFSRAYNVV